MIGQRHATYGKFELLSLIMKYAKTFILVFRALENPIEGNEKKRLFTKNQKKKTKIRK